MVPRNDPPIALCLTTVISHVAMLPPAVLLLRRRWTYEGCMTAASTFTSFMYHTSQSIQTEMFLTELKWHRLDNVAAIASFAMFFTYLACIRDPTLNSVIKHIGLWVALLAQEKDPWNETYTFVPILTFAMLPVFTHLFVHRRAPQYDWNHFGIGFGSLLVAVAFFVKGLDEDNDPFRMFHGMWHVVGGFAAYHLWQIVLKPINTAVAQQVGRVTGTESSV